MAREVIRLAPGRAVPVLLLVLLLQACTWGASNFIAADRRPDFVALLQPPPPPGSLADRDDLATLLAVQATRTPAMEAAARADTEETVFRLLAGMGIRLDPASLPATASLFARLHADESALIAPAKRHWHRSRPFVASPAVRPCIMQLWWSASYPSGHAAFAYAAAEVLVEIVPNSRTRSAPVPRHTPVLGSCAACITPRTLRPGAWPAFPSQPQCATTLAIGRRLRQQSPSCDKRSACPSGGSVGQARPRAELRDAAT